MDLESFQLIKKKDRNVNNNGEISDVKDIILISYFSPTIVGLINVIIIFIAFIIVLFKRTNASFFNFNSKVIPKDLTYYQNIQNYFCDYFRYEYNKEIEDTISLYNVSLNGTSFDMFLYKDLDYLSWKIKLNQSLESVGTLHMLNALNYYSDENNYKNEDILIIDIGANVGWYSIFFGMFKFSVLAFEPYPENYYILKKNYCRNNRDYFGPNSTITIVNSALYTKETLCGYYQDIKNSKKDMVICDLKKEKNFNIDYMRMGRINSTKLSNFIPLIENKKLALLRLDLEFEGENAIESGKELISKYHVPFIFIEFNIEMFSIHKTKPKKFLSFFVENGYKISLEGFLTKKFIKIEKLLKLDFVRINLYLVYIGQ